MPRSRSRSVSSRSRSRSKTTKRRSGGSKSKNPKRIVQEKTAMLEPVGTFHHPTTKTIRTGKCPVGKIERDGYYRHSYTKKSGTKVKGKYVKEACIDNKGVPGKYAPGTVPQVKLKKGLLTKHGYSTKLPSKERLEALKRAVKEDGYVGTLRHVVYIRTLSKNNPKLFKIYDTDVKNLQKWHSTQTPDVKASKASKK